MTQEPEDGLAIPADFVSHLFELDGRVAAVTGGGAGWGPRSRSATPRPACRSSSSTSTRPAPQATAATIAGQGGSCAVHVVDVTDKAAVTPPPTGSSSPYGRVDILVNSAGSAFRSPAEEFPEEKFDFIVGLNLKGTYLCCQAFGRKMLAQGKGSIVNLGSIGSFIGYPWASAYLARRAGCSGSPGGSPSSEERGERVCYLFGSELVPAHSRASPR